MAEELPFREQVAKHILTYLQNETEISNLYETVFKEIDIGILKSTMAYTKGNQSKTTLILTMSRATLRKKLELYDLLYSGKN